MSNKESIEIQEFFNSEIDPKSFAKHIRRLNYALLTYAMEDEDNRFRDWINEGHFWLNSFAEMVEPVIEDKVA
tara:strand:+ start:19678 stop:19896 length:219 start_codon:yes stop_codon:yes gene_type:complete